MVQCFWAYALDITPPTGRHKIPLLRALRAQKNTNYDGVSHLLGGF
jgi:hypothetical protein